MHDKKKMKKKKKKKGKKCQSKSQRNVLWLCLRRHSMRVSEIETRRKQVMFQIQEECKCGGRGGRGGRKKEGRRRKEGGKKEEKVKGKLKEKVGAG